MHSYDNHKEEYLMNMNKVTGGLVALALTAMVAGSSHAAFSSKGVSTKRAVATLTAAGTVSLNSLVVKLISDNSTVTDVAWSNPAVGNWAIADTYLALDAITSATGSGIQIWTDNLNGVAP